MDFNHDLHDRLWLSIDIQTPCLIVAINRTAPLIINIYTSWSRALRCPSNVPTLYCSGCCIEYPCIVHYLCRLVIDERRGVTKNRMCDSCGKAISVFSEMLPRPACYTCRARLELLTSSPCHTIYCCLLYISTSNTWSTFNDVIYLLLSFFFLFY